VYVLFPDAFRRFHRSITCSWVMGSPTCAFSRDGSLGCSGSSPAVMAVEGRSAGETFRASATADVTVRRTIVVCRGMQYVLVVTCRCQRANTTVKHQLECRMPGRSRCPTFRLRETPLQCDGHLQALTNHSTPVSVVRLPRPIPQAQRVRQVNFCRGKKRPGSFHALPKGKITHLHNPSIASTRTLVAPLNPRHANDIIRT
jgi:hypothetical protein